MRSITGNVRRATEDLDLDFIRYSLEDKSIRYFISKLSSFLNRSIAENVYILLSKMMKVMLLRAK